VNREPVARAENSDQLADLRWLIHDGVFDLDRLEWDRERGVVEIPFGRKENQTRGRRLFPFGTFRKVVPDDTHLLRIEGVTDVEVHDTERIGTYQFDDITHDEPAGALILTGVIPLTITCTVDRVCVEVRRTDPE
jgi:hypothetical protein